MRRWHEGSRLAPFDPRTCWPSFCCPLREPAVEYRHRVVSKPPQQPPQTARVHPVVLVVRDHLHTLGNAEPAERPRRRLDIRQRVTAIRSRHGTGKISAKVCIHRLRNVSSFVLSSSPVLVVELEAAIDDYGIVEVGC